MTEAWVRPLSFRVSRDEQRELLLYNMRTCNIMRSTEHALRQRRIRPTGYQRRQKIEA